MDASNSRKTELRGEMARRMREMAPEERERQSGPIRSAILSLPEWDESRTVLAFLPLSDEPDLEPLLAAGIAAGKRVGLPRLGCARPGAAELRFCGVADLTPESFRRNRELGFREPADTAEELVLPAEEPALILVPGRAFDPAGRRLGRGGGYYDRFLRGMSTSRILLVGAAFSCQVIEEVPTGAYDVPVDVVATPEGVLECRLFS